MRGRAVRLLQRRLAALKYYPGRVNGRFGSNTLEAVWAFQETQGIRPRNAVGAAMQQALASHVSTAGGYYFCSPNGCGDAITPTGDFTTLSFMPGWVSAPLGQLYNPVFFIGTIFAIHGDTHVPLRPASHGCVRIPVDVAAFFHTLLPTPGTPVYIRR
jgi:putative peptidoglycan binding protein/L,D-transpeptidase-like protein